MIKKLPEFTAMVLPIPYLKNSLLNKLYFNALRRKYMQKYGKTLGEKKITFVLDGIISFEDKSFVFAPIPNYQSQFDFLKNFNNDSVPTVKTADSKIPESKSKIVKTKPIEIKVQEAKSK